MMKIVFAIDSIVFLVLAIGGGLSLHDAIRDGDDRDFGITAVELTFILFMLIINFISFILC